MLCVCVCVCVCVWGVGWVGGIKHVAMSGTPNLHWCVYALLCAASCSCLYHLSDVANRQHRSHARAGCNKPTKLSPEVVKHGAHLLLGGGGNDRAHACACHTQMHARMTCTRAVASFSRAYTCLLYTLANAWIIFSSFGGLGSVYQVFYNLPASERVSSNMTGCVVDSFSSHRMGNFVGRGFCKHAATLQKAEQLENNVLMEGVSHNSNNMTEIKDILVDV